MIGKAISIRAFPLLFLRGGEVLQIRSGVESF
jgi:hypothetical protein